MDPSIEKKMMQLHRMAKATLKNNKPWKGGKGNNYQYDDFDGGKGGWEQKNTRGGHKGVKKGKGQGKNKKGKKGQAKKTWGQQGWKAKQWSDKWNGR